MVRGKIWHSAHYPKALITSLFFPQGEVVISLSVLRDSVPLFPMHVLFYYLDRDKGDEAIGYVYDDNIT